MHRLLGKFVGLNFEGNCIVFNKFRVHLQAMVAKHFTLNQI